MKRRTYSVLEIWRNYGQEDQELLRRSENWDQANAILQQCFNVRVNDDDKFYLLEVQVCVKLEKSDEPAKFPPEN